MNLAKEILTVTGALRTNGHYVYASGRHGNAYVDKKAALRNPSFRQLLCREIARRYAMSDIQTVIGPESGGAMMAPVVAHELGKLLVKDIKWAAAAKVSDGGIEVLGDDIPRVKFTRTLIVDDILTTGSSLKKVVESTARIGCRVVSACVLVNRGGVTARMISANPKIGLHLDALVTMSFGSWPASGCPLCEAGMSVDTELGHGAAYLERKAREASA